METKEMSTYGGKQSKFSDVETEAIYIYENQSQFRYGSKSRKILIMPRKENHSKFVDIKNGNRVDVDRKKREKQCFFT